MISVFQLTNYNHTINISLTQEDGFINANGETDTTKEGYKHSQVISCEGIAKFRYSGGSYEAGTYMAVFFSSAGAVVQTYGEGNGTAIQVSKQGIPVPDGAASVIFTGYDVSTYGLSVQRFINYNLNGDAVLHPTSCEVTEDAGGSYELSMVHPIADSFVWPMLVCGAIIKAPAPVPPIRNAYIGQNVNVYKTTEQAALRDGPSEATRITYQTWYAGQTYAVGANVTNSNYDYHNYRCTHFDSSSPLIFVPPNNNTAWWTRIADYSSGAAALTTLEIGTEVYFVEDAGDGWYKVSTKDGIIGYIKSSQLVFVRTETVQPAGDRITDYQLFRIYNAQISTDGKSITVNARHVSYDLSGILLNDCKIEMASPSFAIMRIKDALITNYAGEIATNLTSDENGTFTGDLSYKNGTYAFLDPDKGMIPYFRAKLVRDNWDIFLMKNDLYDRGVRLTYGVNLRGVSWKQKSDSLINRVMPVAKGEDGSDLFLPETYVSSSNSWPVAIMERLNVNGQVGKPKSQQDPTLWTVDTLLEEMRTKAGERFSVDHADAIQVEVDVNFTLLGETEEYKAYRGLEKLYMYDLVKVKDPNVGLDLQLQVSQIRYDCITKRYNGIKLGNVFDYGGRTVFGYNIGDGAINYEKINPEAIRRIIGEV